MVQIIPAILATGESEYRDKLSKIKRSGLFEDGWVQIDLMDNKDLLRSISDEKRKFVTLEVIAKYPTTFIRREAHLMIMHPSRWIEQLKQIGFNRAVAHVEIGEEETKRFIEKAKGLGLEVGLAIDPETPLSKIEPYTAMIDVALIMGVNPGFSGQEFIPGVINKIKKLVELRSRAESRDSGRNFKITVDGAVTEKNAKDLVNAGADILVIGNALFKYDNLEVGLKKIQEAIGEI